MGNSGGKSGAVAVVAAAAVAYPVATAAVGLGAVGLSVTVIALSVKQLEKYNNTMREIEARLERQEEECRRSVAEADQLAKDHEEVKEALLKGIRPVVMPTREQFSAAKQLVQYDHAKFHFAVCGTSGSGKSSLINAFRGLNPTDEGAAKVGATECTFNVTRYPDPHEELPYSRFVWYDIPGAGTINVPDWQYFNDQGLFVFDFIVIAYDVRFTKIDEGIIKNCLLFEIPFFVVRSKADQHIRNMMNDKDEECERQEVIDEYVEVTRADFKRNVEKIVEAPELDEGSRQLLLKQPVYIVSGPTLRHRFQTSERERRIPSQSRIDEDLLIKDMLKQAAKRRCPDPNKRTEDVNSL